MARALLQGYCEQTLETDELCEIAGKLDKIGQTQGSDVLKVLKYLDDKAITFDQLKKTLIGKRLTAIKVDYAED